MGASFRAIGPESKPDAFKDNTDAKTPYRATQERIEDLEGVGEFESLDTKRRTRGAGTSSTPSRESRYRVVSTDGHQTRQSAPKKPPSEPGGLKCHARAREPYRAIQSFFRIGRCNKVARHAAKSGYNRGLMACHKCCRTGEKRSKRYEKGILRPKRYDKHTTAQVGAQQRT